MLNGRNGRFFPPPACESLIRGRITDLRLNGRPLTHSETDGYVTWVHGVPTYK